MADLSDVLSQLRALASNALYPPALYPSGATGNSVAGCPVLVQSGWPDPASLDKLVADNAASKPRAQVTIYPRPTERNTTRYQRQAGQIGPLQPATFTLTLAGHVVTVGGAQPSTFYGQNVAVFVNGIAYIYRTIPNVMPATIAAALAALIPGASAIGAAVTIPSPARIGPLRVGTQAPVATVLKNQEREFQLVVWAPTLAIRDAVAAPVDVAIAQTPFLAFADTSNGRLLYKGSPYSDFDQKSGLFRRDFLVTVDYPTMVSDMAPEAIAAEIVFSQEAPDGSTITPPIRTTYS